MATTSISQLPRVTSLGDQSLLLVVENGVSKVVTWAYIKTNIVGAQGPIGGRGYSGSQGPRSYAGSRGYFGSAGFTGSIGFTGSKGSGFTGSSGFVGSASNTPGYSGSIGFSGSAGYQGRDGYVGSKGPQGDPNGYGGSRGVAGFTGSAGIGSIGVWDEDLFVGNFAALNFVGASVTAANQNGSIASVIISGTGSGNGYTGSRGSAGFLGSRGILGYTGSGGGGAAVDLSSVSQNIVPDASDIRDLGSNNNVWRYGYFAQIKAIGITDYNGNSLAGSRGYAGSFGYVGSSQPLTIKDEGVTRTTSASSINFVGATVAATNSGNDVTVTISGVASGSALTVRDEGTAISTAVTSIDFVGAGVTAANNSNAITVTIPGGGASSGLSSRTTVTGTTASIPTGNSANLNLTGFKSYLLMKVAVSAAAWVRIYSSDAYRTSDSTRAQGSDPLPGAGVIAEVITAGNMTTIISPGALGWNDDPISPGSTIYLAVTNNGGSTTTINIGLTILQLEV